MARKRITSRPGLFGTVYYYDENGKPVGKSRPGLLEGTRVYTDQKGQYVGKSRPGFLAKEVFTDEDHNHITSYEGLCGDIHSLNGAPVGHTRPGFFGFEHTTMEVEGELSEEDYFTEDIPREWGEVEDDDLFEDDYEEYTRQSSQRTIVKNFQLLVLCLLISVVIACVYVITRLN